MGSSLVVGASLVVALSSVAKFKNNDQGRWEHVLQLGSSLVVGAPLAGDMSCSWTLLLWAPNF